VAKLTPLRPNSAVSLVRDQLFPAFNAERERLNRIDDWYRFSHDDPYAPKKASSESKELAKRAQTPWGGLIVTSCAQAMYLDGYQGSDGKKNEGAWSAWQQNAMDRRQTAINRAGLAYGYSYATALPGVDQFGSAMAVIRGVSPRRMMAMYEDPANDDWPRYAIQCEPAKVDGKTGWNVHLYDEVARYRFIIDGQGTGITYIDHEEHGVGWCPVVRFTNLLDLEGRADGEIEPFIPLFGRIDQTVFDRLVVQRFASWVVRTASGLGPPEAISDEDIPGYMEKLKLNLSVNDILLADDPDTKFGSLPATPLEGFIEALKSDILNLAAVSQTPAHEFLGSMANLSADALAAARASLTAKVEERRNNFGESYGQLLRLAAWINGDEATARDFSAKVSWQDTEVRSMAQAADALGKMAQMLGVPVEALWERIPGVTQVDITNWKTMVAAGDDPMRELADILDRQSRTP
jgi:hypothetical protein